MNMNLGETLKRLRKAKDLTQEELAEWLGVTFQTVSRWERGESYPDIAMLPGIAFCFNVSIDELLGLSEMRRQTYLNDVFRRAHACEADGRHREAAAHLRQAISAFPNHDGLLSELAVALSFEPEGTSEERSAIDEAVALCERVLKNSTNEKVRCTTRTLLCCLYKRKGEQHRAMELAGTLPHLWESRELMLCELADEKERNQRVRQTIRLLLSLAGDDIDALEGGCGSGLSREKTIALGPGAGEPSTEPIEDIMAKISSFLQGID